jgi:replicative DNA helicase
MEIGGMEYLDELMQVPRYGNVEYYAGLVKKAARKREAIVRATEILRAAYDPATEPAQLCEGFLGAAHEIFVNNARTITAGKAGRRILERAEKIERGEIESGLRFGFPRIDGCTAGGVKPGQVVVVAAATSVGKSALSQCFIAKIASRKKVHVFSLEMTAEEVSQRMLANLSSVNGLKIGAGRLSPDDWNKLQTGQGELESWGENVRITDLPLTLPQMEAEAKQTAIRFGLDLIVIDYLQIAPYDGAGSMREKINAISSACKSMAMRLRVPVLLLSQLSRAHEQEKRRPTLHDLKESSNIEQDADGIILLYRPPDTDFLADSYVVYANVAKWRMGCPTSWANAIELKFTPRYTRFEENIFIAKA